MGKIDDPYGKLRQQYTEEKSNAKEFADEIVNKRLIPFIPNAGWLIGARIRADYIKTDTLVKICVV